MIKFPTQRMFAALPDDAESFKRDTKMWCDEVMASKEITAFFRTPLYEDEISVLRACPYLTQLAKAFSNVQMEIKKATSASTVQDRVLDHLRAWAAAETMLKVEILGDLTSESVKETVRIVTVNSSLAMEEVLVTVLKVLESSVASRATRLEQARVGVFTGHVKNITESNDSCYYKDWQEELVALLSTPTVSGVLGAVKAESLYVFVV